jgi:hypothetical protein
MKFKKQIFSLLVIFLMSISLFFLFYNNESTFIENNESTFIENNESTFIENNESQKLPKEIIFIKSIGELGNQPTQFDNPESMDFFNEKLYVLDTDNGRIQIFSKNLDLLSILPLDVNNTSGIAITSEKIFVIETYNLIKSFDHNGNFDNQFSVTWTRDLLADENFLYVIEPLIESIQVYDHNGNSIYKLGGIKNLHFINTNDKHLVASGTHIAHDPHELLIIDKETRIIEQHFSTSPGTTTGSAITENNIFLLDNGALKVFDFNGNLLLEYFIEIQDLNSHLSKIEINDNFIYVLDTYGHNIRVFEILYE